jgi:hypothetical protein
MKKKQFKKNNNLSIKYAEFNSNINQKNKKY